MKIDIELIKVDEATRIRKDIGDLRSLERSIQQVGLINPILIDEHQTLLAGFRRLSACKNLGWKEVEARVVEMEGDELKMLEVEMAENFYRKEFTPEEILSTERRRLEIEEARRPKGVFERFWTWLKALFSSDPKPEKEPAAEAPAATASPEADTEKPAEKAPDHPASETASESEEPAPAEADEQVEQPAAEPEPEEASEPEEQPAAEPEPEPEPVTETTQTTPSPRQPKAAEIVEEDGVRHIKWR